MISQAASLAYCDNTERELQKPSRCSINCSSVKFKWIIIPNAITLLSFAYH